MSNKLLWLRITAVLGALAIILGAFGAHGLKEIISGEMLTIFETGVKYHFYHVLAMLALVGFCRSNRLPKPVPFICFSWLFGILVFSGSLYILSISGIRWLGAITPIGGVAMIIGWLWLAVSARKVMQDES